MVEGKPREMRIDNDAAETKAINALAARASAPRLPDFIFLRDFDAEKAGNFMLAGHLVTDLPKDSEPSDETKKFVNGLLVDLAKKAKSDPDLYEATIWRPDNRPANAIDADSPEAQAALDDKIRRCIVMVIGISRGDLDDEWPSRVGDLYDAFNPPTH
jgi:hypothetical protein